jgi:hypothetical protein
MRRSGNRNWKHPIFESSRSIEFIPIYGMLGLQRKEATAMGT